MKNRKVKDVPQSNFSQQQSFSIDEILSAGGTTAFANKMRKDPGKISAKLQTLPDDAFLSEEDVQEALEILNYKKE